MVLNSPDVLGFEGLTLRVQVNPMLHVVKLKNYCHPN